MTNQEYREIYSILKELQEEFIAEEDKLIELSSNHSNKISELEQQIGVAKRSEDIDYRVFSPRTLSVDNSEKIQNLEKEKNSLEKEMKEADKQRSLFLSKSEKISKVLSILQKSLDYTDELNEVVSDNSKETFVEIKKVPFEFLDDDTEEDNETSANAVDEADAIFNELFSRSASISDDVVLDKEVKVKENNVSTKEEVISNKANNAGVPVEEVEKVCHKVEFTEKIINNDRVRAKLELKEVVTELNELIKAYQ